MMIMITGTRAVDMMMMIIKITEMINNLIFDPFEYHMGLCNESCISVWVASQPASWPSVCLSALRGKSVHLLKKSGLDVNDLKNFRPVSNLPFLSKILEKVVLAQLESHLSRNNLREVCQSAYRQNHSTETLLLSVTDSLLCKADNRLVSLLTLLDQSAAFDTIDHKILLNRLSYSFGISGTVFKWFISYLTNRTQSVSVGDLNSLPLPLKYGVP